MYDQLQSIEDRYEELGELLSDPEVISDTKRFMINQVYEYAASSQSNAPFSVYYSPSNGTADGSPNGGKNR